MKHELDRLMEERGLSALVVVAGHSFTPALDYLVGRVRITGGLAVKKPGTDPVLIVGGMELEEAAASGLEVRSTADMKLYDFLKESQGDTLKAQVRFWHHVLTSLGVLGGRVGVYGEGEFNSIIALLKALETAYPQFKLVGDHGQTLFDTAALTKSHDEIERVKSVAARTSDVLQATWDFIAGHRLDGEQVVDADGQPLTIGMVKRFVRRELLARDLEDTGMIFAQGRDAGYPHSRGQENEALRPGASIVFDLFPHEIGGGYHHDVTRTWCIGHAPEAVQKAYDEVREAYDLSLEVYQLGQKTSAMQHAVCDYFESKGHQTARSHPGTLEGYVHSLGHGIGLKVHEGPRISHMVDDDVFEKGNVITIEPGLYYPEQGFGVRYEDALYIDDDGRLVTLTDFRPDLVIPMS